MRFSEGREKIEDDEHSGQPLTARSDKDVQEINENVRKDWRPSLGMIALMVNTNKETVRKILHY